MNHLETLCLTILPESALNNIYHAYYFPIFVSKTLKRPNGLLVTQPEANEIKNIFEGNYERVNNNPWEFYCCYRFYSEDTRDNAIQILRDNGFRKTKADKKEIRKIIIFK